MGIEVGGLFGLIVLVLDIYAIVKIVGSGAGTGAKVLWILAIIIFPIVGFIVWLLMGPSKPAGVMSA
jgi:Phospholipase_D-nuclease N-terminal